MTGNLQATDGIPLEGCFRGRSSISAIFASVLELSFDDVTCFVSGKAVLMLSVVSLEY